MRSRLTNLRPSTKMLIVSLIAATALGISLGSISYVAISKGQAGCDATHAVITNLNAYFKLQVYRIENGLSVVSKQYAKDPAKKIQAIRAYQSTIDALEHVRCS